MRRILISSVLVVLACTPRSVAAQPPSPASPGLLPVQISASGGTTSAASFTCTTANIGTTSTDGCILTNPTAAAAGAQQWSPRLRFTGQGWKTTATAASQTLDWIIENQSTQDTTNPYGVLTFSFQTNGGGYTRAMSVSPGSPNNGYLTTPYAFIGPTADPGGGAVWGLNPQGTDVSYGALAFYGSGANGLVASAGSAIGFAHGSPGLWRTNAGTHNWLFASYNDEVTGGWTWKTRAGSGQDAKLHMPLMIYPGTAAGAGANIAGYNLTLAGGQSTGSGVGGDIIIQTSIASGSSSTTNALGTRWTFKGTGGLFSGNAAGGDKGADSINLATNQPIYVNGVGRIFNVAAAFTTAANTNLQTITGLSWTLPANVQMNVPFSCKIVWQQGTAAVVVSFGFQTDTVTPTSFLALGQMETNLTTVSYADTTIANTTATVVVSGTPAATATTYNAYLDGFLENPSNASTTTVNVMVKTATAADAVTISRGSFCRVF